MEWTKIKTNHYLISGLSWEERGKLATYVCLVAHLERKPTPPELRQIFGRTTSQWVEKFPRTYSVDLDTVTLKVLEDVEQVKRERNLSRERQRAYRENHKNSNALHNGNVTQQRREEKRREEYSNKANHKGSQDGDAFLKDLEKTYPRIDVKGEINKATLWLRTNRPKRKVTKRYLLNWMNRAYEKIEEYGDDDAQRIARLKKSLGVEK